MSARREERGKNEMVTRVSASNGIEAIASLETNFFFLLLLLLIFFAIAFCYQCRRKKKERRKEARERGEKVSSITSPALSLPIFILLFPLPAVAFI